MRLFFSIKLKAFGPAILKLLMFLSTMVKYHEENGGKILTLKVIKILIFGLYVEYFFPQGTEYMRIFGSEWVKELARETRGVGN